MSRLEAGACAPKLQPVALEEVVPAALPAWRDATSASRVNVPETLPQVLADPALLERALANLAANALRYSPADQPGARRAGRVRHRIDLRVIDLGPGVPPAPREQVFEPFQRLGDNGTDNGVGLGLARGPGFRAGDGRRARARRHTGRRDSTAIISLPVRADRSDPMSAGVTRVLVVDDEDQIRRALATNLRARGYEVDQAATGEQALSLAADHHPDAVILDIGLPGVDGIEVVRGLRGWSTVPIIMLTVREDDATRSRRSMPAPTTT